jgi:hypothetical protein
MFLMQIIPWQLTVIYATLLAQTELEQKPIG